MKKILSLKIILHSLVNKIFYFIIFGFGYLIGISHDNIINFIKNLFHIGG